MSNVAMASVFGLINVSPLLWIRTHKVHVALLKLQMIVPARKHYAHITRCTLAAQQRQLTCACSPRPRA